MADDLHKKFEFLHAGIPKGNSWKRLGVELTTSAFYTAEGAEKIRGGRRDSALRTATRE
jgi:hypothetical protein